MMSENWQDWDSPEYMEFLEQFYSMQMALAAEIADGYDTEFRQSVFEKLATPAVYLKAEYTKWLKKNDKKAIPEQEHTPMTHKATPWRLSNKNPTIEWCPEQDADPEDVKKAMAKEDEMWHLPAKGDYRYGSIFRKVKS